MTGRRSTRITRVYRCAPEHDQPTGDGDQAGEQRWFGAEGHDQLGREPQREPGDAERDRQQREANLDRVVPEHRLEYKAPRKNIPNSPATIRACWPR